MKIVRSIFASAAAAFIVAAFFCGVGEGQASAVTVNPLVNCMSCDPESGRKLPYPSQCPNECSGHSDGHTVALRDFYSVTLLNGTVITPTPNQLTVLDARMIDYVILKALADNSPEPHAGEDILATLQQCQP